MAAMKPYCNSLERLAISSSEITSTPLRTVSVTASPAKKAPQNSKTAAMMMALRSVNAPLPTLVPMALATSLAPIFHAMYAATAMASIIIRSSPNIGRSWLRG